MPSFDQLANGGLMADGNFLENSLRSTKLPAFRVPESCDVVLGPSFQSFFQVADLKRVLEDNHIRRLYVMGPLVTESLFHEILEGIGISVECLILSDGCIL